MATKVWTGNAQAVPQIETYAPGPQLPNTTITATVNAKTASYTSPTGSNDDLITGLLTAVSAASSSAPEFAEIRFQQVNYLPAVPAPNATYLQMSSKTPGVPFTVSISLTQPAQVNVTRVATGSEAVNELQKITISPNAQSGSYFTLTWGGHTTNNIPTPPSAPTTATGSSGVLTGAYLWAVTFVTANGETEIGLPSTTLTLAAQQGSLTTIPLGPSGTTKRKVYRTKAGGSVYFLVTTISDNTTTTYTDNTTDGTIGANPGPPTTNGVLQGELEALSGVGQGNVKVGGSNVAAVSGQTMPTSPIIYTIEFRGTLGGASQPLVSGAVSGVTILPTVSISTVATGCPPQNEIQTVGWEQVIGTGAPIGTFAVTLPGLNVMTAPISFNASAATLQAALVAAAGPAYAATFSVTLTQSTNAGYLYQITYQGTLGFQAVPLATVDVSKIVAAAGDTVTGYQAETQKGTASGRNSTITVTLNNGPGGGTFGVTGTLANGATITSTGISYSATAATFQASFPANTAAVTGSAGGPYTIEALGEAGNQNVTWTATSSLTGGTDPAGSPPGSNTTTLSPPTGFSGYPGGGGGALTVGTTYYYVVTATNAAGETTGSSEISVPLSAGETDSSLVWNAVAGATGYKVYRGTSSGGENVLIGSGITSQGIGDSGGTNTAASPPGSNTAGISVPTLTSAVGSNTGGNLATATYYYKVTATNASGETTGSGELSAAVTGPNGRAAIQWGGVGGATGYKVYRGTSSGSENTLIGTISSGFQHLFEDYGNLTTAATPPSSNTTALTAPVQTTPSTSSTGGNLASNTYYYEVTATNAAGETTASNEKSIVVTGPTGEVTINWNATTGASGYRIYRGTSTNGENVLAGIVPIGSTTTFLDTGLAAATFQPTEVVAGSAGINEQQLITLTGATGGNFSLAFEGQGTPATPYNDTAADVQTKLQALSSVGVGNMTVIGSNGGPYTVTGAGALAGMSLPLIAANSANLMGMSTATQSLTATQAATGPNFWDNANNWSPIGVPATGDSVYFQNSTVDCLYNLSQPGTILANLQIDMSYVGGQIGLPGWNGKYYEYRPQYLQVGVSGTILIGNGKGSGPTLIKLDTGTNATKFLINNCGTSTDPTLPAILWKGNRSSGSTEIDIYKGSMGIAMFAGETATVDVIRQGYVSNVGSDSYVFVGAGTALTTWYKDGGDGALNCNAPTVRHEAGTLSVFDGLSPTAVTTLNVIGGTLYDRATGLITTLTVGTGAVYDRTDDSRPKTITTTTIYGKSTFLDPHGSLTFTNPYTLSNCGYPDLVKIDLGTNITGQRTQL